MIVAEYWQMWTGHEIMGDEVMMLSVDFEDEEQRDQWERYVARHREALGFRLERKEAA